MTVHFFEGRHNLDRRALALIDAANADTDDELQDTTRVALWLGVSPEWLEIGRSKGWGPPFVRPSPRRVRYRVGAVKLWLQDRAHRSTSEYADPAKPSAGRAAGSKVIDGHVVPPPPEAA
jgi:hypothetical protein